VQLPELRDASPAEDHKSGQWNRKRNLLLLLPLLPFRDSVPRHGRLLAQAAGAKVEPVQSSVDHMTNLEKYSVKRLRALKDIDLG
jgi:hypothetical protein